MGLSGALVPRDGTGLQGGTQSHVTPEAEVARFLGTKEALVVATAVVVAIVAVIFWRR